MTGEIGNQQKFISQRDTQSPGLHGQPMITAKPDRPPIQKMIYNNKPFAFIMSISKQWEQY